MLSSEVSLQRCVAYLLRNLAGFLDLWSAALDDFLDAENYILAYCSHATECPLPINHLSGKKVILGAGENSKAVGCG